MVKRRAFGSFFAAALPCMLVALAGCVTDEIVVATLEGGLPEVGPPESRPPQEHPCNKNSDCFSNEWCDKPRCDDDRGHCAFRPLFCGTERIPTCGCDGVSYWNDCIRKQSGVGSSTPRECEMGVATCSTSADCPIGGASCARLLPPGAMCGAPTLGVCWMLPFDCPDMPSPETWTPCSDPGMCVDTCAAIGSGAVYQRSPLHMCPPPGTPRFTINEAVPLTAARTAVMVTVSRCPRKTARREKWLDRDRFEGRPTHSLMRRAEVAALGRAEPPSPGRCPSAQSSGAAQRTCMWAVAIQSLLQVASLGGLLYYARANRKLAVQAERDALTGLHNRRAFIRLAEAERRRSRRYGRPLALAFIDLDDFKRVNDEMGHLEGDRLLASFARILAGGRDSDVAARLGGDEFVLLMPETDRDAALAAIERIRWRATLEPVIGGRGVTFSTGIAAFASAPKSVDAMLEAADHLLREAKQSRKSTVRSDAFRASTYPSTIPAITGDATLIDQHAHKDRGDCDTTSAAEASSPPKPAPTSAFRCSA